MSQPSMPFTAAATDPLLPSIKQEAYTHSEFEEFFGEGHPDQSVFCWKNSDVLDDPDHSLEDTSLSHTKSSETSTVSAPDFSNYCFGLQTPTYSHTNIGTSHPYPSEQQQTKLNPTFERRLLPFRAHTNVSFNVPSQPPHGYHRRRSLSHNDVDRIATPPNPTFMRLQSQTVRGRSTSSGERDPSPHVRSRSHGRPLKNAVPYTLHGSPLINTYPTPMGTSIGTPLSEDIKTGRKRARILYTRELNGEYNDPLIRHMTDPVQLAHSHRIIEIGAMAVRDHSILDPKLDDEDTLSMHERVIKKLDDVERYLRLDGWSNEDALEGCEMIREALMKKVNRSVKAKNEEEEDELEAPSAVMSLGDLGLFSGHNDENNFMGLVTRKYEG
jgi:hypothetical protein